MSDSYATIRNAIAARRQVVATYGGHERALCPHAIGTKGGRAQALFFQFAGGSERGLPPGGDWRCLAIDGLSEISVRDGDWHTDPSFARPSSCIDEIDLEVASPGS